MKVTVRDDYANTLRTLECFGRLDGHDVRVWSDHVDDDDTLAERLADSEALVLIRERTAIRASLLERLPQLRLISLRSTYPHVDVDACTRLGVVVSSNLHSDSPSYATAELAWALVLAAMRQIPQQAAALRAGHWQTGIGRPLRGLTLGLFGYGRIARVVAGYGEAFGMRVQVWAREMSREHARHDGYDVTATKASLFATSDVVSLHLRLVDATRGIVTASDLAAMTPDALLVNTSRAGIIAPGALTEALAAGRPGLAAVDVCDHEPLHDTDDPLLSNPRVVCTPHIGYLTREEFELQFADVFDQINTFAAGTPTNVINPAVLAGADRGSPR